mgnify:CR=1 FL=1
MGSGGIAAAWDLTVTLRHLLSWIHARQGARSDRRHHAEGGPLRNLRRVVELAAEMRQRTIVDVVTAIPMTSAQEERLRAILERRLGTRIDLNCEVDPEVIGGARVMIRNHVLDHTVRGAVAELRTRLAG